jgi:CheY-like chemotaxis protein
MSEASHAAARVLVVEDDVEIRLTLAAALVDEGFDVVTTPHGQAALDYLRACLLRPSVILLDLRMPIMDGRSFLEARALEPGLADIPVIVLTADYASGHVPGASCVLIKPFVFDRLLERMSALM